MDLTEIFCHVDDFYKAFEKDWMDYTEEMGFSVAKRKRKMYASEVMTVLVMFHQSHSRDLKSFYLCHVRVVWASYFPNLPSYQRFVELQQEAMIPMYFLAHSLLGECSGISFVDSTKLVVSHVKRARSHKTFAELASWSKDSIGWFFGFKLHLVVNDIGEILSFRITRANVDDRSLVPEMMHGLFGRLYGDRGYISQDLFDDLYAKGISLMTTIRKNMKPRLMTLFDSMMLKKRVLIETINDHLKNVCQIDHTRHRSPYNFFVNLLSGLVCYSMMPKKPSLDIRVTVQMCFPF